MVECYYRRVSHTDQVAILKCKLEILCSMVTAVTLQSKLVLVLSELAQISALQLDPLFNGVIEVVEKMLTLQKKLVVQSL